MEENKASVCKRIWILRTLLGNPLLTNQRPERAGALAAFLADQGYKVTFWGAAFDHKTKKYTSPETIHQQNNENEDVLMLNAGIGNRKNMSLQRLIYGRRMARILAKEIEKGVEYPRPDLIFAAYPTEESCRVAEKFGKKYNIPVIVDARDMWPDIFDRAFPSPLRFLAPFILFPLKRRAAKVFQEADALCGMSPVMLSWALAYAGRERTALDRVVFISARKYVADDEKMKTNLDALSALGVTPETWNICLFTSLSKGILDSDTMIQAVRLVHETHPSIRLIIGGKGDDEERLTDVTRDIPYIYLMGFMDQDQMSSAMSICKAGMLPYKNTRDMKNAWGNKVGQYLSYGLPILNSTEGIAKGYLEKYHCGVTYREGDSRDLADAIIKLMDEPAKVREMSENAYSRFEADFDEKVVLKQLEELIQNVYVSYAGESESI